MQNSKAIFVTGATGNQGGAVARNLVNTGFHIKALTRDSNSPRAQELKKLNIEVIRGDLDKPLTYSSHLQGVDAVFSVQAFEKGAKKEKKRGMELADLAKKNGIGHFLYSSVAGADLHTGIPHWESKFEIENHIKKIGLHYTIIRPSSLFENFLIPQVKTRLLKGKLVSPVDKNKIQQYMSAEDIGRISAMIFMDPGKHIGKTIELAADQMDLKKAAGIFSDVLGKQIKYQKLPMFITRLAMGKDLYEMFNWVNANDAVFIKDLDAVRREYPSLMDLEEWIRLYFK